MKVLITGATGLIGSELVNLCHKQNIDVNYLTTSKNKIVSNPNYSGFYWNPENQEIDSNCFKGVTSIINLAGAPISKRWTPSYKQKVLSSRVNALRTLYTALEKVDSSAIASFISASGIGVYPSSFNKYYAEDEIKIDKSFLGDVVKAWETETDAFKKFPFKVSKIRIGVVLSSKGGALVEMARPIQYFVGAAFGNGKQWQSWIHITDLTRMFLFAVEHNLEGVYNGVAPNPVTNSKLVKEIAKVLKRPIFLPNIPKIVMKTILGEMAYLVFASQRVSSKKIEEQGFTFQHRNVGKALENIYQ